MSVIFRQIQFHAVTSPARPAIMLPDRIASFSMIASGTESARAALDGLRLDREKPVALLIENPIRHIILGLALIKSGYAIASVRRDLLNSALEHGISTVLTDERLPAMDGLRSVTVDERWFNNPDPKPAPAPVMAPGRIVRIVFTSGSTGRPKPLAHTLRTTVERMQVMAMAGLGRGERLMCGFGLSGPGFLQSLLTISNGRTICFAPAAEMLPNMIFTGADAFRGSVAQLRALVGAQEELGRPLALKQISVGGALMSFDLLEQARASFGCEITYSYSSEEAGLIGCASGALLTSRRIQENCYFPMAQIKVCGTNDMDLPSGSEGVIHVRSACNSNAFTGALDLPDEASCDWLRTGDRGFIDADGILILGGRGDEVINMGGAKFDPEVIEAVLIQHPLIDSVAVLAMTAPDGGHEAWAFVSRGSGLDAGALNEWFAKRASGEMRAMGFARVELIDSLPKTASGKIDRGFLRSRFSGQA